jgi:hypothetical protein
MRGKRGKCRKRGIGKMECGKKELEKRQRTEVKMKRKKDERTRWRVNQKNMETRRRVL